MAVFREDPYGEFNFLVEIEGVGESGEARAGFQEVSGLGVSIDTISYRNGNALGGVRKLPGLARYSNVTLRRGVTGDLALWEWIRAASVPAGARRNVRITLLDEAREAVLVFVLRRAWPCKWEGPALAAKTSGVALETLEICHEGLELE